MTHLATAQQTLLNLRGKRNTFGPGVAFIDESGAHTRCSSFVTLTMKATYPVLRAPGAYKRLFGRPSPYAADYGQAIENGLLGDKPFAPGIVPGDLLSIDYDGGFNDLGFTGHSALIEAIERTPEFFGAYRVWLATVIDSCASSHGPGDTRYLDKRGSIHEDGGIGRGVMRLLTDPSTEAIMGYTWSVRGSSPAMVNGRGQIVRVASFPPSVTGVSSNG